MTTIRDEQRMRITGTVVAAILGCHPYLTEVEAQQKVLGNAPDFPVSDAMRHGLELEKPYGFLDREAEAYYGTMPRPVPELTVHPEHDFLAAHLDRMLHEKPADAGWGLLKPGWEILEYKTTSVLKDWGPDLTDEVPLHVYWQVAHQLLVTPEAPRAHIQAFLGIGDMRHYVIERADASLPKLESKLLDWYGKHIVDRVPVEPDSEADARILWPKESQKTKEMDKGAEGRMRDLVTQKKAIDSMEKGMDELRLDIMKDLGEAEGYTLNGDVILRWKQRSNTRLDTTRLKKEDPETFKNLIDLFPKTTTTRAFTPVWQRLDKMFGGEK